MYQLELPTAKEYVEKVSYVKKQKNGVMVLCQEDEAQGFLCKNGSTIYAIEGKGLESEYEIGRIFEVPIEVYIEEYVMKRLKTVESQNEALVSGISEVTGGIADE